MTDRRMLFGVGLVTLAAGAGLAVLIVWFGELHAVFRPEHIYYFTFERAPGVAESMPVRRAGIPIGEVRAVEYLEDRGLVQLTVAIQSRVELRDTDRPALGRTLLGDAYLEIEPSEGKPGPVLEPGSALQGRLTEPATDLIPKDALEEFRETARQWTRLGDRAERLLATNEEEVNRAIRELRQTFQKMEETLQVIGETFDGPTRENLQVSVKNLREVTSDLRPLVRDSRGMVEQAGKALTNFDAVATDLGAAIKPLSQRSDRIAGNLDAGTESLQVVLADLRALTAQLRSHDGTVQRLMRDPSLYENLDTAAALLVHDLAELRKVIEDMKVFADKIARHPGELGVQGVFSRDAGLKNVEPGAVPKRGASWK